MYFKALRELHKTPGSASFPFANYQVSSHTGHEPKSVGTQQPHLCYCVHLSKKFWPVHLSLDEPLINLCQHVSLWEAKATGCCYMYIIHAGAFPPTLRFHFQVLIQMGWACRTYL